MAYKKWRKKYLPFIQEIQKHIRYHIWEKSKGNMDIYQERLAEQDDLMDKQKLSI